MTTDPTPREAADLVENVLVGNHAHASPGEWGVALRVLRDHARGTDKPSEVNCAACGYESGPLSAAEGDRVGTAHRQGLHDERPVACEDAADGELARTLRSLHSTLVTQVRDMGADRMEAWLWGVLVGWDCGPTCEDPTDPEHSCDGAMRELSERFGWSPRDVAELRRLRASVVAALAAPSRAPTASREGTSLPATTHEADEQVWIVHDQLRAEAAVQRKRGGEERHLTALRLDKFADRLTAARWRPDEPNAADNPSEEPYRAAHDPQYAATWRAIATGMALGRHPAQISADALEAIALVAPTGPSAEGAGETAHWQERVAWARYVVGRFLDDSPLAAQVGQDVRTAIVTLTSDAHVRYAPKYQQPTGDPTPAPMDAGDEVASGSGS